MTSNFKLIRRFFKLVEENKNIGFKIIKFNTEFNIEYRNFGNPDLIIRSKLVIHIFDHIRSRNEFLVVNSLEQDFIIKDMPSNLIEDLNTMEDMELYMKYGREISDSKIIQNLQTYDDKITLDTFRLFLQD